MQISFKWTDNNNDDYDQGWGEYWTYEYEYWKISTRVVLQYNVFSIFMFIILGKMSTWVVLAPALIMIMHEITYLFPDFSDDV